MLGWPWHASTMWYLHYLTSVHVLSLPMVWEFPIPLCLSQLMRFLCLPVVIFCLSQLLLVPCLPKCMPIVGHYVPAPCLFFACMLHISFSWRHYDHFDFILLWPLSVQIAFWFVSLLMLACCMHLWVITYSNIFILSVYPSFCLLQSHICLCVALLHFHNVLCSVIKS